MTETDPTSLLHEALRPHLTESRAFPGMKLLHHPLVVAPLSSVAAVEMLNKTYLHKLEQAAQAVLDGAWATYVFLHERPYRFEALIEALENDFPVHDPDAFWSLVGRVWTDSENIWQSLGDWQALWTQDAPHRESVMDEEERDRLASLPDEFTVWRGTTYIDGMEGMSWTVNRETAFWFARRFASMEGRRAMLVEGTVLKKDVLAYFNGRNEQEIVVAPDHVRDKRCVHLDPKPKKKKS